MIVEQTNLSGAYITLYAVHSTLCTIQTRAEYTSKKPRVRAYMKYYFVTKKQAGSEFYLR